MTVKTLIPQEMIARRILLVKGKKVMLDRDLAQLYNVSTKALNQAVKRNNKRFPDDFMFKLNLEEKDELVTNCDRLKKLKYSSSMPYAFTEPGVAMLSTVLNSEVAIQVNIQIIRTFMRLREMLMSHKDLQRKIDDMERKYDEQFKIVFEAIRQLLIEEEKPKRTIGFHNR